MKKFTLLFVFAFILLALFSQPLTVSYVNGYKILTGEYPAINVRDFPVDSYEQGKIQIKLDRSYEANFPILLIEQACKDLLQPEFWNWTY